jgi:hypothetical protein
MDILMIILRVPTFQMIAVFLVIIWAVEYLQEREERKREMAQGERLKKRFHRKFKSFLEKCRHYWIDVFKAERPFSGWYLAFRRTSLNVEFGPCLRLGKVIKEAEGTIDRFTEKYLEDRFEQMKLQEVEE